MKQISIYKALLLVLIVMFNQGCDKDVYKANVIIEQDGELYSASYDEAVALDESNTDRIDWITEGVEIKGWADKYVNTENLVDVSMYNFLVVIPIKSKDNLKSKFNGYPLVTYLISDFKAGGTAPTTGYYNISKDIDGYYRYNIYIHAQFLASRYYLNDIIDVKTYVEWEESDWSTDIEIKSNKLTIKAEQFEHMLDRLAISHERLSFQPDRY